MVLLAALQALLGRIARRDTVVVGTPVAGRERRATEDLVGFLVNTLALRGDVGGAPTFRELLARTRARALGAFEHQELPFERLADELRRAGSPIVRARTARGGTRGFRDCISSATPRSPPRCSRTVGSTARSGSPSPPPDCPSTGSSRVVPPLLPPLPAIPTRSGDDAAADSPRALALGRFLQ
jgi:hypothetical protein